ncbi:MAG: Glucose-6-phosphate isomerase [Syntrophus sp. SKADARSKE-3]|nr:Glucose-6-phosphate isomerase [Syntrophus sp. SKADARSKE-3]
MGIKGTMILGSDEAAVIRALAEIHQTGLMSRIWSRDYTVWKPLPTEIANRLGWLDSPRLMADRLQEISTVTEEIRGEGYTHALLLGMGGSSLAPEVFRKTFGVAPGFLDLAVCDTTDPGAVLAFRQALDPARTLFIVSTKSGGTVETVSLMKYFYNEVVKAIGAEEGGRHFVAITDPGSGLADMALKLRFRHIFYNDPDIGGRYSALSFFGLVPATLLSMNVPRLLESARALAVHEEEDTNAEGMNAATLGTAIGELALMGRNKLTFVLAPELESFGDWLEQLIAESTGKEGKGIVPIVGEPLGAPSLYGPDRLFVAIRPAGDRTGEDQLDALAQAGHPVIRMEMDDRYDLGAQFFLWELATAVAANRLGINPFDQPDVEAAKVLARRAVEESRSQGGVPVEMPNGEEDNIQIFGGPTAGTIRDRVTRFLEAGRVGDYVAIQAYVRPTPAMDEALRLIRIAIRASSHLAVTVGYGPRFLHSTGQLHKGDGGMGLFIQITTDDPRDLPIPDEAGKEASSLAFGVLKAAQARGDLQALQNAGRRVIRLHIKGNDIARALIALFSW